MRRLTRHEVREIDRLAIDDYGLSGLVLMENAGAGVVRQMAAERAAGPVAIACGRGNNGGDGFVIARHLSALEDVVRILLAAAPEAYRGDAAVNLRIAERSGLEIRCLADADEQTWQHELAGMPWIVDALLGTGASGPPRGGAAAAIAAINAARRESPTTRVVAVDVPSGLDADTGDAPGVCVRADLTVSFVAEKAGFANPAAATWTGPVHVAAIGAPACLLSRYGLTR